MKTTIRKWGGIATVRIPAAVVQMARMDVGEAVEKYAKKRAAS